MALIRCALAAAVAAAVLAPVPAPARGGGALVAVANGTVRGAVDAEGRDFLGIPYAAPPTGRLRFRPPRPAQDWAGVRDATRPGAVCPQSASDGVVGAEGEDCLLLDVHTPPARSRGLPVMVWLHGGAYTMGSGAGYDPAPLVAEGVVVVTVNYRLGALGFLALPGLADESGTTGNYALLDQQAALRWVRAEIGAFGGDPRNVTVFGESAGGHSVCVHLVSPTAAGLFDKAVSQSGGCVGTVLGPVPAARAYASGEEFAASVGCADPGTAVACLRGKPAAELTGGDGDAFLGRALRWVPVVDGHVVREPVRAALESGRYHRVPLLSGTNRHEGRLFLTLGHHLAKLRRADAAELDAELLLRAGEVSPELRAAYPPASADDADLALSAVTTDGAFACPALAAHRAAASHPGQRVYAYEFADPAPPLAGLDPLLPMGAYHGAEIWYLFRTLQGLRLPLGLDAGQQRLSDHMTAYWAAFARTGAPEGPGLPAWPAFTPDSPRVQRLTPRGAAPSTSFAGDHACGLWDGVLH